MGKEEKILTEEEKEKKGLARVESDEIPEISPEEKFKQGEIFKDYKKPIKKETRGRKKGTKNKPKIKKPVTEKPVTEKPASQESKIELPDIKIPLAKFVLNLTDKIGGKWKANIEEAKFIEESFDYWTEIRAAWIKKAAPEIFLALSIGNYFLPRLFPNSEQN